MSYATVTRHLRILRRKIEGLMGKSFRRKEPPWWEVSRYHWDLLWTGEETLRKYGTILWEAGHKSITLFPGALEGPIHKVLQQSGDGSQNKHAQVPFTKRVPVGTRHTLQSYLNLVDWEHILDGGSREDTQDWSTASEFTEWQKRHNTSPTPSKEMGQRITDIIHEPTLQIVMDELKEITEILDPGTSIS